MEELTAVKLQNHTYQFQQRPNHNLLIQIMFIDSKNKQTVLQDVGYAARMSIQDPKQVRL